MNSLTLDLLSMGAGAALAVLVLAALLLALLALRGDV